ncbi:MAG: hypothetical protein N2316_01085, partial [Spirochaetes bacterium]|nr:hypothetical protein [Spirochaetota bacterium]
IVVTGEEFDGDIVIDKYYFSPHKDGSVKISPKFWKKVAHDEWKLIISREDGEVVFEKKGKAMLSQLFYVSKRMPECTDEEIEKILQVSMTN